MEKMEKMKNAKSKMQKRKRSIRDDERAVSPVIGVIMMVAIVVIISAVVAAFAYGIIGGVTKAPSAAIITEGATVGETNVTFIHHGGDTIVKAFDKGVSENMKIRYNGKLCILSGTSSNNATLNGEDLEDIKGETPFEPGDELEVNVVYAATGNATKTFESGDSVSIVYKPSGDILQRITVV